MSNYVSVTWLLANLLHPFALFFYFGGEGIFLSGEDLGPAFVIIFYLLIFSLPSLLLGLLAGYLLSLLPVPVFARFGTWLLASVLIVILNIGFVSFLFGGKSISLADLEIGVPAMIAAILASLVRYPAFARFYEKKEIILNLPDENTSY